MQTSEVQSQPTEDFVIKVSGTDDFCFFHGMRAHVEIARETVRKGGKILFVQEHDNAASETVRCISTLAEIDVWNREIERAALRTQQS